MVARRSVRIVHRPTGTIIAEGSIGWGITPFDGGYYVARRHLVAGRFETSFIPGLCLYKGLYSWMNFHSPDGTTTYGLAWFYFLPNPLFPFIWFRVGIPRRHPELTVIEYMSPKLSLPEPISR